MSSASLVPRKELASIFLSADHARLTTDAFPAIQSGQPLPREELEHFLASKTNALAEWRGSVATQYRDAFERSHRLIDVDVERQNFRELKRIYQSGLGLHAFLKVLLEGPHESNDETAKDLKNLKKEHQRLSADNASLVASLAVQQEELTHALAEVQKALTDVVQLPPLDEALEQFHREQSELQAALSLAEQEHMELTTDIGSLASKGSDLDRDIQQEMTACTLLRELIAKHRQEAMSKDNERERIRGEAERHLKEMGIIAKLMKTIGGTDILEINGHQLTLSMRTDTNRERTNNCSFVHRLTLELHPTTFLVERIRLEPDEGIVLDAVIGQALKTAVGSVRHLLFLSLHQRAHLDALEGYVFTRVDPRRGIWRVPVSDRIEVECLIPFDWPYNKEAEVKLLDIQSAAPSISVTHVRDKIRSMQFRDLQAMLDAVIRSMREQGHL